MSPMHVTLKAGVSNEDDGAEGRRLVENWTYILPAKL